MRKVLPYRIFRRGSYVVPFLFCAVVFFGSIFALFPYIIVDIGYLARPIWDKETIIFPEEIVHYYAEGMSMEARCEAHGWKARNATLTEAGTPATRTPLVYDAVIFSVELDMLEIRMRETWDVVDKFLIVESNGTFTGLPKDTTFADNRKRFAFAESKIVYKFVPLYPLTGKDTAWDNEGRMRWAMQDHIMDSGVQDGDVVTFSDVDEVISKKTLELFKYCEGTPDSVHMHLNNYIYSYEYPNRDRSWRSSVNRWKRGESRYNHGQNSKFILSDAGWHCSFCFRTIDEFRFKMLAYSHADRVRTKKLLETESIQKAICDGTDLWGMFPEAFTFKELLTRLGGIPKSTTAVGLPLWVLENRDRFRYLLPGGCQRGDSLLSASS
ncbi:beta-1,4-mannosyl-glycoprotein beta-1,4-N-acetylglucosaminyltransferase [Entomortierella parvispora]|uniref:Beta-1,4-mannosyl-glycoprotein beta-1,4-N-acetylglucosaminyltransferase n=1 Tax=Entomortierella parvispora TaxID=205924 RepID=A0A9P3HFR4_9FUNG|nr:beta-1,4-mannosyl-glycoprotein beta-1,4-N-acetylglucosaminyltransferase [Entomortierella parvispora]